MRWRKVGRIFAPSGERPWMRTHAAVPVPLHIEGTIYRIYFTTRDDRNRSHVAYLHVDLERPSAILELGERPALAPGPLGCFDDHGVYANSLIEDDGRLLLYYIGWNPGPREPLFYASIGLATSQDGGRTFERVSPAPVLARSEHDPCFVTSPFVLVEDGRWRMWYVSGVRWTEDEGRLWSTYHVKYAESSDGVAWHRDGLVCIDNRPGERNIVRPCVLRDADRYRAWFAYDAGSGYRIGYAESGDGLSWDRLDEEGGMDPGPSSWESDAVAYPFVFRHDGRLHMLYSGNDFGRGGFGLAVEEAERR